MSVRSASRDEREISGQQRIEREPAAAARHTSNGALGLSELIEKQRRNEPATAILFDVCQRACRARE